MKKTILALAVVAVSLVSVPAYAQKKGNKNVQCTEQCAGDAKCSEQCKPGGCNDVCEPATCGTKKCDGPRTMCVFEGLNLTDAQKQQLKDVKKPGKRMAEQCAQQRADRARQLRAAKAAYLQEIKAILTPEQYVEFLENSYLSAPVSKNTSGKHGKKGMQPRKNRPDGPSINARGKRSAENQ